MRKNARKQTRLPPEKDPRCHQLGGIKVKMISQTTGGGRKGIKFGKEKKGENPKKKTNPAEWCAQKKKLWRHRKNSLQRGKRKNVSVERQMKGVEGKKKRARAEKKEAAGKKKKKTTSLGGGTGEEKRGTQKVRATAEGGGESQDLQTPVEERGVKKEQPLQSKINNNNRRGKKEEGQTWGKCLCYPTRGKSRKSPGEKNYNTRRTTTTSTSGKDSKERGQGVLKSARQIRPTVQLERNKSFGKRQRPRDGAGQQENQVRGKGERAEPGK